jgi:type IV pilus assembly protein PilY1
MRKIIMSKSNFKRKTLAISALLSSSISATSVQADDVEVYVIPPSSPIAPNVLFVLDESGSMNWGGPPRRMEQLKTAMRTVLNDTDNDNINAGILAYTTRSHPTRVVHDFALIKNQRSSMISAVNSLNSLSGTPSIHALASGVRWYEAGFRGAASPIASNPASNWCKPNYIVFLSDGSPNSNHYTNDIGSTLTLNTNPDRYRGTNCGNFTANPYDGNGGGGSCAFEIGNWGLNTDLKTGGEWDWAAEDTLHSAPKRVQNIRIHSIGMDMGTGTIPSSNRERFMKFIADNSGGTYFRSGNADQLTDAFQQILNEAKTAIPYTYNAPTIPFDQNNAAISGDDIYVPVFKPGVHQLWYGNLKKYRISYENSDPSDATSAKIIVIRDKDGDPAINSDFLFVDSTDKWNSGSSDGGDPLIGGSASHMETASPTKRNLYTYLGSNTDLTASANLVEAGNNNITATQLGDLTDSALSGLGGSFDDKKEVLLDWMSWADDVSLPDGNGGTVTVSHEGEMGALLHTQPVLVRDGGNEYIFIATTEGVLHALDGSTGEELWAFMPQELLNTIPELFISDWNASKPHTATGEPMPSNDHGHVTKPIYGLDGATVVYTASNGHRYLVQGMRRGGNHYYALDITDPENPEMAWQIDGGAGNFTQLGQTWSKPIFTKVEFGVNSATEVLIFGGGYDTSQDDSFVDNNNDGVFNSGDTAIARSNDSVGKAIYFVNPTTGAALSTHTITNSDMVEGSMNNAIAADVLPVDINANGITDRLYVADVGGRLIRVDIPDHALAALTGSNAITATVVADINGEASEPGTDYQRLFNTPEVAYFNRGGVQYLALMIVSGHRPEPLSKSVTNDRFYMIKDPNVWKAPADNDSDGSPDYPSVLDESDLYDATANLIQDGSSAQKTQAQLDLNAADGWLVDLATGEKGFSAAKVYDYAVLFTTYSGDRSPSTDGCDALTTQGESQFYALNMTDGSSIFAGMDGNDGTQTINDRKKLLKVPGMPPAPALMFPKAVDNAGNVKLGGEVLAIVGLQEAARWPDRFHPISWEEVIDD